MNFSIQTLDDEHDIEQENLIDAPRNTHIISDIFDQPSSSTPTSPYYLSHARSDTNLIINLSTPLPNDTFNINNNAQTNKSFTQPKRSHSTRCSAS